MDIVCSPPFRARSIAWQERPGQWTLTVVCKVTYALAPGTALLAPEPEDVNERDNHWDDDLQRSVYAPSDLSPFKPRPEVVLVGSAFAPHLQPVRAIFARLSVGELDKSIEVFGLRVLTPEGALHEGPRWTQMPLRYERAGGGPDTWNPVGVPPDAKDAQGYHALPNLQPPGLDSGAPAGPVTSAAPIPPIGFGPLTPTWRLRRAMLRRRAATWSDDGWTEEALGEGFDGAFFQAAPADQRVEILRADEQIVLEHLHPEHPRLVTRLPGVRPRARVEAGELPSWELTLVADTLWIDTNRAVCTLTWRGQIPLDSRDPAGVVLVGIEEEGRPARFPPATGVVAEGLAGAPLESAPPHRAPMGSDADQELFHTVVDDSALASPALPFRAAPPGVNPDAAFAVLGAPARRVVVDSPNDPAGQTSRAGVEPPRAGLARRRGPAEAAPRGGASRAALDRVPARRVRGDGTAPQRGRARVRGRARGLQRRRWHSERPAGEPRGARCQRGLGGAAVAAGSALVRRGEGRAPPRRRGVGAAPRPAAQGACGACSVRRGPDRRRQSPRGAR